jgi:hypothetical protein
MSKTPPLLPAEVLRRVLRLARFDGISVLGVAGIFAIGSASLGDYAGALVALAIAGAGVFELHGVSLVDGGHARGVRWLVGSQLYLLVTVLGYVLWKITGGGVEALLQILETTMKTPEGQMQLEAAGKTREEMLAVARVMYFVGMVMVAVLTFFYQGGMAVYYYRRRQSVAKALDEIFEQDEEEGRAGL